MGGKEKFKVFLRKIIKIALDRFPPHRVRRKYKYLLLYLINIFFRAATFATFITERLSPNIGKVL
jgi:hypothetical protein